ncbi:hypothetical protein B0H14DRAFT_3446866 [Mycena olivaceomarginata]|nr:hypothetical protein B0H14DRAFT_3446866 [Mycena olivaceomarginata]
MLFRWPGVVDAAESPIAVQNARRSVKLDWNQHKPMCKTLSAIENSNPTVAAPLFFSIPSRPTIDVKRIGLYRFCEGTNLSPVFVLALVLNPFQKLSRFGDKPNIDPFVLSTELIALYKRVKSRPPSTPRTPQQQQLHEQAHKQAMQALSAAFMQYLAGTGPFKSWENPQIRETYIELNSNNPIPFWEMFRTNALVTELANFSLMLLHLVVNQAGLERSFSDFSNKKNKKRNRLGLSQQASKDGIGLPQVLEGDGRSVVQMRWMPPRQLLRYRCEVEWHLPLAELDTYDPHIAECQSADWKFHKSMCKALSSLEKNSVLAATLVSLAS